MLKRIQNTFHPSRFQGEHRRRNYFEGYYLKVVDPVHELALAFIPGISYDAQGRGEAFLQVLDGVAHQHAHYRYPASALQIPDQKGSTGFAMELDVHRFSDRHCYVDTPELEASFSFRQNQPWPWQPWSPGAMGPFSFVPAMQCKHGVVSLWHQVEGTLVLKDTPTQIKLSDQAFGYIEKDWGSGFPERWIWLQSNHFQPARQPACIMVSAGHVPWIIGAFEGHIASLLCEDQQWIFSTYNGSRMQYDIQPRSLDLNFKKRGLHLHIHAERPSEGIAVDRPEKAGALSGKVNETLQAKAFVELTQSGQRLFESQIEWTGLEVGGSWPNS